MSDWMTIRVVLLGQPDEPLDPPPGRVILTHADHTFTELAEAIDTAFARWDLTPLHRFEVEGRVVAAGGDADEADVDVEDSDDTTVGEVGLRVGARFRYVFDPGERWEHECLVEDGGVDPFDVVGDEPEVPVPVFGWGTIPDQYGRESDEDADLGDADDGAEDEHGQTDDEQDADDEDAEEGAGAVADAATWTVVARALSSVDRRDALQDLEGDVAAAAQRLRDHADDGDGAYATLWDLSDLGQDEAPDEDADLWLELAAAVVAPNAAVGDVRQPDPWATLEAADWAGAVIELVRDGVGAPARPADLVGRIERCPEVESDDLTDDDRDALEAALETVVELWQALGALDEELRLTGLGRWGLPEALRLAWTG